MGSGLDSFDQKVSDVAEPLANFTEKLLKKASMKFKAHAEFADRASIDEERPAMVLEAPRPTWPSAVNTELLDGCHLLSVARSCHNAPHVFFNPRGGNGISQPGRQKKLALSPETKRKKENGMAYHTHDGTELTREQIAQAVKDQRAVLRWQHGNWKNYATLVLCNDAEEAEIEAARDTRGECWSMAEECWSDWPRDVGEALRAAAGTLSYS